MGKTSGNDDDSDLDYSSIQLDPNWNKLDILAAVAEVERIRLEEEKERKLRRNLSTFLELGESETEGASMEKHGSNGFGKLRILADKIDGNLTKGKSSLRKKSQRPSLVLQLLANKTPLPMQLSSPKTQFDFDFGGKHQEDDGNQVWFSYGDIIQKPQLKRPRSSDEENCTVHQEKEMPCSKKAKKKPGCPDGPLTSTNSPIPEKFKNRILDLGGSEESIIFVFQKVLTKTDVETHFSRLLVPFKQIKNGFLTDDEQAYLHDPNQKSAIDAIFVDPSLDEGRMILRKWDMGKKGGKISYNYALITHWSKVVGNNKLGQGMTVHLWAFRRDLQLGFALILV